VSASPDERGRRGKDISNKAKMQKGSSGRSFSTVQSR
jgi:hypothetical protein